MISINNSATPCITNCV